MEEPRQGPEPGAIDVARVATLAYLSEDPAQPVEHLLDGRAGPGGSRWAAARLDEAAQLVIEFDAPQTIGRLVDEAEETERERTPEVRVEASTDGARPTARCWSRRIPSARGAPPSGGRTGASTCATWIGCG